jgi:hypothetical protein
MNKNEKENTVAYPTDDLDFVTKEYVDNSFFRNFPYVYGVEYDDNNPDPALTRIGNLNLHRTLPV